MTVSVTVLQQNLWIFKLCHYYTEIELNHAVPRDVCAKRGCDPDNWVF